MTGLLITAAILLVLLLILCGRVTVVFDYGEELYFKVSYLIFTVIKVPAKRRKSDKKDRKAAKSAKKLKEKHGNSADKTEKSAKKLKKTMIS